jgi:DNA-binding LacI/PurR family transcriptional regulator
VFVFDELRSILAEAGLRLEVRSFRLSRQVSSRTVLQSLLATERPAVCLLYQAERPLHRWFHERRLPCVVFGTQDSVSPLPALDLDQRATCRHAAQMLLRGGYSSTQIVLAIPHKKLPGHMLMRQGFHDALGSGARVFQLPDEPSVLAVSLDRLLATMKLPAGLIFGRASHATAALGHFAIRRGLRIPADVGILSLSDDPFLRFIQPVLTRYERDDAALARQLAALIVRAATGAMPPPRMTLVMPELIRGETV